MIHVGARPVFCDIDDTYTHRPGRRPKSASRAKTVGILPVHLYGRPANIDAFQKLAARAQPVDHRRLRRVPRRQVEGQAGGQLRQARRLQLLPLKNLTVYGDGGAIATEDAEIARKVTMLRNHGRKDKYLHEKVGYNLRFNEIQAAVGREQLKVLDDLNAGRRRAADVVPPRTGRRQGRHPPAGGQGRRRPKPSTTCSSSASTATTSAKGSPST